MSLHLQGGVGGRCFHLTVLTFAGGSAFLETWPPPTTLTLLLPQVETDGEVSEILLSAAPHSLVGNCLPERDALGPAVSLGARPDLTGSSARALQQM